MNSIEQNGSFLDQNHALRAGLAIGILLKSGLFAAPVIDDYGNYTNTIRIEDDEWGEFYLGVFPEIPDGN